MAELIEMPFVFDGVAHWRHAPGEYDESICAKAAMRAVVTITVELAVNLHSSSWRRCARTSSP